MNTHFPDCVKGVGHVREKLQPKNLLDNLQMAEFITEEKVKWSYSSFGPHMAAGPDGIKPVVLQNCGPVMITWITNLYKCSVILGYVHTAWCNSKTTFIPKPGKEHYDKPKSFRPISLSSFLFTGLERIVLNDLEVNILPHNPIHKNQHAFMKGRHVDFCV